MTSRTEAQILDSQCRAERRTLGTVAKAANHRANQASQVGALPPVETVATGIVAAVEAIRRQVEPSPAKYPYPVGVTGPVTSPMGSRDATEPKLNGDLLAQTGSTQQNSEALSGAVSYIRAGWHVGPP
jgi:hypothetical protein